MKSPDNIEAIAALIPDMMGFIFYPKSPRYASPESLIQPLQSLPKAIKKVGVFVNETPERILEISTLLKLDYIQLHGGEPLDVCLFLKNKGLKVIKVFSIQEASDLGRLIDFEGHVDYFLFDTKTAAYGGSGRQFDWRLLSSLRSATPWLLSGGIGAEDGPAILKFKHLNVAGIDANSRLETAPGLKDPTLAQQLIQSIRQS